MRYYLFRFIFVFLLIVLHSFSTIAQTWDFVKEKDGIKIYTRSEIGKSLKFYKGIADIDAPADKVFALLEDVNNTDWWDKNFKQINVLLYEKNKRAQYYLVYGLPWPITDRDLCVYVTVKIDSLTGVKKIIANPRPDIVLENHKMVRIKEYRQTWTISPEGKEQAHVELEGYIDPAGGIPDWISNMLIVNTPFKTISEVKQRLRKK